MRSLEFASQLVWCGKQCHRWPDLGCARAACAPLASHAHHARTAAYARRALAARLECMAQIVDVAAGVAADPESR